MPNGTSLIGRARSMTTSVAMCLENTVQRIVEYLQHLESRKRHLEALLAEPGDKGKADVRAMLAVVDAAIAKVKQAIELLTDATKRTTAIEARL